MLLVPGLNTGSLVTVVWWISDDCLLHHCLGCSFDMAYEKGLVVFDLLVETLLVRSVDMGLRTADDVSRAVILSTADAWQLIEHSSINDILIDRMGIPKDRHALLFDTGWCESVDDSMWLDDTCRDVESGNGVPAGMFWVCSGDAGMYWLYDCRKLDLDTREAFLDYLYEQ